MVHAAKLLAARALVNPVTGRILGLMCRDRISARGLVVDTRSQLIRPEVKALLAFGMYESSERRLVARYLRSDLPVVELGASIGYITGQISRHHPPRQVAVEANPFLLPLIQPLLQSNGLGNAKVILGAIDYSGRGVVPFRVDSFNLRSAVGSCGVTGGGPTELEVPAFTLGNLLTRERIGEFTLVCDIEGAERGMIMEEDAAVRRQCRQMIIELHAGAYKNVHMSTDDMSHAIMGRWLLHVAARDGNNWVFQ